jgi:hypothetical protein
MSYSRFIEHDVYVFMHANINKLVCMACSLGDMDTIAFTANSTQEMIDHLETHTKANDRIPENIHEELWRDDLKNYPQNT